jgi:hypothetical protein
MKKTFIAFVFSTQAAAAPFHYDAMLTRGSAPLNGALTFALTLEDSGGQSVFNETRTATVVDGQVSLDFGDADDASQRMATTLVVTLANVRFELALDAAPRSAFAESAQRADSLDGFDRANAVSQVDVSTVAARQPTWASVVGLSNPISAGTIGLQDVSGFDSTWRDEVDADTRFTAGAGLSLVAGAFSLGTVRTEQIASAAVNEEKLVADAFVRTNVAAGAAVGVNFISGSLERANFKTIPIYQSTNACAAGQFVFELTTYTTTQCAFSIPAASAENCPATFFEFLSPAFKLCRQKAAGSLIAP